MTNILPTLSAKTLFHFTNSLENLISIIENNFYPRYSYIEIIDENDKIPREAVPMVCFCDTPLSQVKNHMNTYGNYGIGLSKEWGKLNQVTPVLYYHENSPVENYIDNLFTLMMNQITTSEPPNESDFNKAIDIWTVLPKFYFKRYEGKLLKNINGKFRYTEGIKFYDEREWRYVPSLEKLKEYKISTVLTKKEIEESDKLDCNQNLLTQLCKLSFEPNDIKYLILANGEEILDFRHRIENAKGEFKHNDVKLLGSKIITKNQIFCDF